MSTEAHGRTAEKVRQEAASDSIWAKGGNLESSEQAWWGAGGHNFQHLCSAISFWVAWLNEGF